MITLSLNLDPKQTVRFASVDAMRKSILANPFKFDGLSLFANPQDEDAVLDLVYITDGFWEVEVAPKFESSSYTIAEAVEEFISCLSALGIR